MKETLGLEPSLKDRKKRHIKTGTQSGASLISSVLYIVGILLLLQHHQYIDSAATGPHKHPLTLG